MREFYVYGFKSRGDYGQKSSRSYDDEKRRIESWLGDHMHFVRTAEGKNVFLSIDSRVSRQNPFYKALKAKSFTDGDITLHFLLFDLLHSPEVSLSLPEITEAIDRALSKFPEPMLFDESTVRKKLKEYIELGLIVGEKSGRKLLYRRTTDPRFPDLSKLLQFYSEVAPCGVVGSYLLDRLPKAKTSFTFKHHYINSALDSQVTMALFRAMREGRAVTVHNHSRRQNEPRKNRIIPLRIFISAQNGRQHLLAYQPDFNLIKSFRIDYLSNVKLEDPSPRFEELRRHLDLLQEKMWGVTPSHRGFRKERAEYVTFTLRIEENEPYILDRLQREKRVGFVEQIDERHYRFTAIVYDCNEMIPWIRSFICRITDLHFSNKVIEQRFKTDLLQMYERYEIKEDEET
ncbi:MAG: WYL domain-containing protein [Oscillospiraceae bacterium]|nr:WYL domain-containing protein [Oscillospiraceae bacterium]